MLLKMYMKHKVATVSSVSIETTVCHHSIDIEVEHPIDHEQAQEVEELPMNNQTDISCSYHR